MRHERKMVKALLNRQGFVNGVAVDNDELAELRQPTLLVYGANDPVGSAELWQRTLDRIPHGTLHVVQGAGPLPWYDNPTGVGPAVSSFLNT